MVRANANHFAKFKNRGTVLALKASRVDHLGRGSLLHPIHVFVVGRGDSQRKRLAFAKARSRPNIDPFLDLRVAIGEGKTRGHVMITCRTIHDPMARGSKRIIRVHIDGEPAVVNAVLAFVHKDPSFGRRRIRDMAVLPELPITAREWTSAITQISIHRNGANTRRARETSAQIIIRRATIDIGLRTSPIFKLLIEGTLSQ